MPVFKLHREVRNRERWDKLASNRMNEFSSSETTDLPNAHRNNTDSESEECILTQVKVNEQIRNYIAPLTKQLVILTQFIQGVSTAYQPNFSQRASTSANSSEAGKLSDKISVAFYSNQF